jgi:hypothetical protein
MNTKFFVARRKNVTNLKLGVGGGGRRKEGNIRFGFMNITAEVMYCTVLENRQLEKEGLT